MSSGSAMAASVSTPRWRTPPHRAGGRRHYYRFPAVVGSNLLGSKLDTDGGSELSCPREPCGVRTNLADDLAESGLTLRALSATTSARVIALTQHLGHKSRYRADGRHAADLGGGPP
jgi:hypothetical protein